MQKNNYKLYCYVDKFNLTNLTQFNTNINIIFRNYTRPSCLNDILKISRYCKKNNLNFYLSNNIKLSLKLGLNGVYIPSFNKKINYTQGFSLPKNFKIIGSAHNKNEINLKIKQKCTEIFLSPVFKVKKSKSFLGVCKFNLISLSYKVDLIALGGINEKNFNQSKMLNSKGIASISWAKKNGLSELRPF